jgi:hypothetical protein
MEDYLSQLGLVPPEDETQKLLSSLPPAKTDQERFEDIYKQTSLAHSADLYDPLNGQMTKGSYNPAHEPAVQNQAIAAYEADKKRLASEWDVYNKKQAEAGKPSDFQNRLAALGLADPNAPIASEMPSPHMPWAADSLEQRSGDDLPKETAERKLASDEGNKHAVATAAGKQVASYDDLLSKFLNGEDGDLKKAQGERDRLQGISNMSRAFKEVQQGLSKDAYKPDYGMQDQWLKEAQQPITDLAEGRKAKMEKVETGLKIQDFANKAERRDPNSPISRAYRDMARVSGLPIPDDMTADAIKESYNFIDMKMKMDAMALMQREKKDSKADETTEKQLKYLSESIDPNKGARGPIADTIKRYDGITRAEVLAQDLATGGIKTNFTDFEQQELARTINQILTNSGSPAQKAIEDLVPHSMWGDVKKLQSYVFNNPYKKDQTAFGKQLINLIGREKETVGKQLHDKLYPRITPVMKLFESSDPEVRERAKMTLSMQGLNYDEFMKRAKSGNSGPVQRTSLNDYMDKVRSDAKNKSSGGGMVQVTNGTQVLLIPESDVENAAKDGYHKVQN